MSVATSIKDIWNALRARWHGDLTLLEHYPAAGSFPGDGDDLYQAIIGLAGAGHDAWPGRRRQLAVRVTAVRWALLAPVAAAALTVYARSPLHPHP